MTTSIQRICLLKPLQEEHRKIQLESGKNLIGRSRDTNIRDARCSKEQLELDVDMKTCTVNMKVLGTNPSSVNGVMAVQHSECTLEHGDLIEIVYGRHIFQVVFKPPPTEKIMPEKPVEDAHVQKTDIWESFNDDELLIFTSAGVRASEKIAGYDLDWTIIKTRSGNVFAKKHNDWDILYPQIPKKLKRLYDDGFKICIFTNQGGIGRGKIAVCEFKSKVAAIIKKLDVPVQLFAATRYGHFRKPLIGMWMYMCYNMNNKVPLQLERCFYVGDAAGRGETGKGVSKRRKDHSLADRLFAKNIGIPFYTPEMHFLGHSDEPWTRPSFEPTSIDKNLPLLDPPDTKVPGEGTEFIVMVGLPGSGKSYFCKEKLPGYTVANGDKLGGTTNCLKLCEKSLVSGKSCVMDNTNLTIEARAKCLELAKQFKVPCRCFLMNITESHAKHNMTFRELTDTSHAVINEMTLNGMKKRYIPPTLDEGFDALVKVNWKPKFENDTHEKLYEMYLLDK